MCGAVFALSRRHGQASALLDSAAVEFADLFPDPGTLAIQSQRSDPRFDGGKLGTIAILLDHRYAEAAAMYRATPSGDDVGTMELFAARSSAYAGDVASVEADLAAIEATTPLPPVTAVRILTIRAALAALAGDTDGALAMYAEVLRRWSDFQLLWEVAWTGIDMAMLLDSRLPPVRAAAERARELFARTHADAVVRFIDDAVGRAQPGGAAGHARRADIDDLVGAP